MTKIHDRNYTAETIRIFSRRIYKTDENQLHIPSSNLAILRQGS